MQAEKLLYDLFYEFLLRFMSYHVILCLHENIICDKLRNSTYKISTRRYCSAQDFQLKISPGRWQAQQPAENQENYLHTLI